MSSSTSPRRIYFKKVSKRVEVGHAQSKSDTALPEAAWRKWIDVVILCFVNLTNYTDRYNLAGILTDVQTYFDIKNDHAGLIQTIFVTMYMVAAPLCGYLGDRHDRKILLAFGVFLWNAANAASSFMTSFWAFLLFRGMFGVGQACYTTVAPTIISDLFVGNSRSKILAIFYVAIPVGGGLGYIVGSQMTQAFNSWRWSLRATPFVSILSLILLLLVLRDPKRGHSEGKTNLVSTSWKEDVKYLLRNRSFMLSTMGFTAVAFSSGAISWWAPKLILMGLQSRESDINPHTEGSIYGFIALAAGFFGLCLGYFVTFKLKPKYPQIDPVVCALGLFISGPILIGTSYAATYSRLLCYTCLFFGLCMINLNWAIVCDILLYVVVPPRRSSAVGIQLLVGHGLGDAGSPYLLGLLSDVFYDRLNSHSSDSINEFKALQYAFFIACAVEILGSCFFFLTSFYILSDMERVKRPPSVA
ncbi:hypothetical protein MTP99_005061 [Tenebrio molitor]|jgi:MFS family permease|nr:hypothetical protein MTP99_005061 [Tenebrio molitor]